MPDQPSPEAKPPATAAEPLILPKSSLALPPWKQRKFRDCHGLGLGGSVDIVRNAGGQLAAFVADPAQLSAQDRAEIVEILNSPRYAIKPATK